MPVGGLAGRDALLRPLEAVVERVAHEVHERVAERVDDGAVELGVLADELQLDLLAELGREVAHQPREAQEDGLDRDHPDLHDHRLQRLRGARQVLHRLREAGHVGAGGERLDLRPVQHQLAHEVHQLVEPLGVDADRRGAALARGVRRGAWRGGRGDGLRSACSAHDRVGDRSLLAVVEHRVATASPRPGDLGHRAGGGGQRRSRRVGDQPGVDLGAGEASMSSGRGCRRGSRRARRAPTAPCRRGRTAARRRRRASR